MPEFPTRSRQLDGVGRWRCIGSSAIVVVFTFGKVFVAVWLKLETSRKRVHVFFNASGSQERRTRASGSWTRDSNTHICSWRRPRANSSATTMLARDNTSMFRLRKVQTDNVVPALELHFIGARNPSVTQWHSKTSTQPSISRCLQLWNQAQRTCL